MQIDLPMMLLIADDVFRQEVHVCPFDNRMDAYINKILHHLPSHCLVHCATYPEQVQIAYPGHISLLHCNWALQWVAVKISRSEKMSLDPMLSLLKSHVAFHRGYFHVESYSQAVWELEKSHVAWFHDGLIPRPCGREIPCGLVP